MALPPARPRTERRTITASAVRLGSGESEYAQRMKLGWQSRALAYIDLVPELNYASRFYAKMLKQLKIFPAFLDEHEQKIPIEEGLPVDLLNRIQDPGGGRSQILGNYGRLMFTTGEGVLFGHDLNSEDEEWLFVWNDEIKVDTYADGQIRLITWTPADAQSAKEYEPEDAQVYRMWTPHPRKSGEADSPMRAALEIAEELVILTKAVRATAVTRMTNGILAIAQELSPGAAEPVGDEDPLNNPFLQDLTNHLEGQVENAGSAAAAAPFVLEGPSEYITPEYLRWIQTHDPQTDYMERDLRKEAVERLARGLDFPPEDLLGLTDANHWSGLFVTQDRWRMHGAPVAEQFCDDLNDAYLRKALREEGFDRWNEVVIGYDESQIVVKPDRSDDLIRVHAAGALSDDGLRQGLNISDDWAPSEEEQKRYLAIKLRDSMLLNGQSQNGQPAAADVPPPPGPEGDSGRQTRIVASAAKEIGAAEMALLRCRELAGIRIRQKEKQCPDCLKAANGQPNSLVAAKIGEESLAQLRLQPIDLVRGGADGFTTYLVRIGYGAAQAKALAEMVEVFASRTIYDARQPELPTAFSAHLERARSLV